MLPSCFITFRLEYPELSIKPTDTFYIQEAREVRNVAQLKNGTVLLEVLSNK
jgi:hypothetical protein